MKKSIVHITGAIAYSISQWLIITFITRELSIDDTGIYAYYLAILTPASVLFSFGLRNSIATDNEERFKEEYYITGNKLGVILFFLFYLAVAIIDTKSWQIAFTIFLTKLSELNSEIAYGKCIRKGLPEKIGISKIYKLLIVIVLAAAAIKSGIDSLYVLFCYPAGFIIIYYFYDRKIIYGTSNVRNKIKLIALTSLIKLSLPLAIGSFIISLGSGIPRIYIKNIIDNQSVGLYALLTYFISIASIPIISLTQVNISRIINGEKINEKNIIMNRMLIQVGIYSLIFIIGMVVFSDSIISKIYNIEYKFTFYEIIFVSLAGSFQFFNTVTNSILVTLRNFKAILYSSTLSVLTTIVFGWIFIKAYGLTGMFMCLALTSLSSLILTFLQIKNYRNEFNSIHYF